MMQRTYAAALMRLRKGTGVSESALVKNLVAHLRERGRLKLLPGIARELRALYAREKTRTSVLEVAHAADTEEARHAARRAGIEAEDIRVNHALIRGWRATSHGVLVDTSAHRALVDLYRNITR